MHKLISPNQSLNTSARVCANAPGLGVLKKYAQWVIPDRNRACVANAGCIEMLAELAKARVEAGCECSVSFSRP